MNLVLCNSLEDFFSLQQAVENSATKVQCVCFKKPTTAREVEDRRI